MRYYLTVSYETGRLFVGKLNNRPIGLLLCDEGHRLKNGESQTLEALSGLDFSRRVIAEAAAELISFAELRQHSANRIFEMKTVAGHAFHKTWDGIDGTHLPITLI